MDDRFFKLYILLTMFEVLKRLEVIEESERMSMALLILNMKNALDEAKYDAYAFSRARGPA